MAATRMQESNNLNQIGIALRSMETVSGAFPQATAFWDKNGKPGLSWRVAAVPNIESSPLYKQFKFDEPWDSPHNKKLIPEMPSYFGSNLPAQWPGMTRYLAVVGKGSAFDENHPAARRRGRIPDWQFDLRLGLSRADITDGPSNTIIVVTVAKPVPWTKPEDFDYTAGPILPRLDTELGGTTVVFADGSVKFLNGLSEQQWRAYMTANGGD
jgi:hypothetical protein